MTNCLFCKIARGEIPSAKVAENEHYFAFRDISPQAPVHVLVIPKRHFASLNDAPDPGVVGGLVALAMEVVQAEGLAAKGHRLVINTGPDGGQTVDHLHLHVLGGRQMKWPPG